MQYLSPSTFFGETLSGPLDKKAIQLGRKKLFAELELSGGSTIELHGKPFTKNDIIKYFEDLLKEDALAYHNAVGEDQALLGFLEQAYMGRNEKFLNNSLYEDEQFIHWISPYFCNSFTAFMEGCLLEPDEDALTSLLSNRLLMTTEHLEQSWGAVTRLIMNDISTLESFHEQDKKKQASEDVPLNLVTGLMEYRYIRMILLLPQGRFASLRDKYALCMLSACIDVFNNHIRYRSYVKTWLENAKILAVSPEVKDQIIEKLEEINGIQVTEEKKSGSFPFKMILFVLILVARIATWNSGSSHSSYENSRMNYTLDTALLRKLQAYRDSSKYGRVSPDSTGAIVPMDTVTVTHTIR